MFHTFNAYDDTEGRVVVDLIKYEGAYDVSVLDGKGPLTLDRWTIDPAARHDRPPAASTTGFRSSRAWTSGPSHAPHRYGYSAVIGEVSRATIAMSGDFADQAFGNALLKHDLARGTTQAYEFGRDATAGEAVFVPTTADAPEDDGYVMAFVHNPDRGASDLVILAAQDFGGEPVARVRLPARVPLGFHGSWIPDE